MPRDGANIYTQPFPDVASDTTIESVVYNGFTSDVANDLNAPRPILAGGTGGATADAALTNLSAEKSLQVVTNYNSMVWMPGSFYSASSATGAPVAGHAFVGLVYLADSNNIVLEARDQNDTAVPGRKYVREKKAGTWSVWKSDSLTLTGTSEGVSGDTADMFFGLTGTAPSSAFIVNTESDISGINALEVSKAGNMVVRDTSGQAYLYLNKSSGIGGKSSDIYGQTNGLNRWSVSLANTSGEAGGNVGSNFNLNRYDDAGTVLDTPLYFSRLTGLGVLTGDPTDSLGIATKQYVDTGDTAAIAAATRPGSIVQSAFTSYATYNNISTVIPYDDTIPQSTEGGHIMTAIIVPTSAANKLRIRAVVNAATSVVDIWPVVALFRDAATSAIAAATSGVANQFLSGSTTVLEWELVAGSTASTEFRIHVGPRSTGTVFINGNSASRYFGGTSHCTLVVEEIKV